MTLTPKQVQKAFKVLGWTIAEAAYKMDVDPDTIRNWVYGKSRCKGPAALLLQGFVEGKPNRPYRELGG